MTLLATILAPLLLTIPAAEMHQRLLERQAQLDRYQVTFNVLCRNSPLAADPLDESRWEDMSGWTARLTVLRPEVLYESLTTNLELARYPFVMSTADGHFTARRVPLDRFGRTHYTVDQTDIEVMDLAYCPVLQNFEIHMADSHVHGLTLAHLLSGEYSIVEEEAPPGMNRYVVTGPGGTPHHGAQHEIELDDAGTPWHVRSTFQTQDQPFVRDSRILQAATFQGVLFPTESMIWIQNPNVANFRTQWIYRVASLEAQPELTANDVRIDPYLRNAQLRTYNADGSISYRVFNEAGDEIESSLSYITPPFDPELMVSRESLRPRRWIPIAATAVGACVTLALFFTSRLRKHALSRRPVTPPQK